MAWLLYHPSVTTWHENMPFIPQHLAINVKMIIPYACRLLGVAMCHQKTTRHNVLSVTMKWLAQQAQSQYIQWQQHGSVCYLMRQ